MRAFKNCIPLIQLSCEVDGQLIAIGNTTWQTKNLTSVSIDSQALELKLPEPNFESPKPVRRFRLGLLVVVIAFAWAFFISFKYPPLVGIPLTALACVATWFIGYYSHENNVKLWNSAKEKSKVQTRAWKSLLDNPPIRFSLVLDSSSGKSVAVTNFDLSSVTKLHSEILSAMRAPEIQSMKLTIAALALPFAEVEELYVKFCREEISHAAKA